MFQKLKMFQKLRQKAKLKEIAHQLYGSIVAQVRKEAFYLNFEIPDTSEGRYELLSLHLFMLLHVWKKDFGPEDELAQYVLEHFFSELDGSLREMGISDLKVPKKMRALADGFYVRLYKYSQALDSQENKSLQQALKDYLYQNMDPGLPEYQKTIDDMIHYVRSNLESLQDVAAESLRNGHITFQGPSRSV